MKNNTKTCLPCAYTWIMGLALLLCTFVVPYFDRTIVRDISGAITFGASVFGAYLCILSMRKISHGHGELNRRLRLTYYMMIYIFVCTGAFGISGVINPPVIVWDVIYNTRAVAIVLEVFALYRFFTLWWDIGRQESKDNAHK